MAKNYRERKQIRLEGYDYRNAGAYFVTICTHNRMCLFGKIVDGKMQLNSWGQIVICELKKMEQLRENVVLDVLVCMPNHLHIILWILVEDASCVFQPQERADDHVIKPGALGAIIRGLKSAVTMEINLIREDAYPPVWQSRFNDRIIRNERELNAIRCYIRANPSNWEQDHEWNEGFDDYLEEP